MGWIRHVGFVGLWLALLGPSVAAAEPLAPTDVPEPLKPWVSWVLQTRPELSCPVRDGEALCYWPGELVLALGSSGGTFRQQVRVDRELWVQLPGSEASWPEAVRVDRQSATVLERDGVPMVRLVPGDHEIDGTFVWARTPERLAIPTETARVSLVVSGEAIARPRRDESGQLWLAAGDREQGEGERLELTVHRRIEDGVPMWIDTRLTLRVSGRGREVNLGKVVVDGSMPVSMTSDLPARLEQSGELRLQLRAGTHRVAIRARTEKMPEQLSWSGRDGNWPEREIWVWQPDESLRQVELSGAPAIDPARTDLDEDWRGLSTYLMRPDTTLAFKTTRRGEASPPPNELRLSRQLWLDLDGGGYTARDTLAVNMREGFRLDFLAGELGHVSGQDGDLLITTAPEGGHPGVELRRDAESLTAEWRAEGGLAELQAVGWASDVQQLDTALHMGPGWGVLAATGVDEMPGTWVERWDLFGFFFVLLVALAVGRLVGWPGALLTLVALVLTQYEPGEPGTIWLVLLAFVALLRVVPEGRLRTVVKVGCVIAFLNFLGTAAPFVVQQMRQAVFPQLSTTDPQTLELRMLRAQHVAMEAAPMPAAAPVPEALGDAVGGMSSGYGKLGSLASSDRAATPEWLSDSKVLQQDPEAVVQTGPGVPQWQWRVWNLSWSGPVDAGHQVQLWLVPPPLTRLWSALRAVLVVLLWLLFFRAIRWGPPSPRSDPKGPHEAVAVTTVLLACMVAPTPARADLPDQALLDQLEKRLTEPPVCRPNCVSIQSLDVAVEAGQLILTAEVHAADASSVRLPGPVKTWVPARVAVQGTPDAASVLRPDGYLHVRVDAGTQRVVASGPMPSADTLTLALGDRPHRVHVRAEGYRVDGVKEDGRVDDAIQLSRVMRAEDRQGFESGALPPWFQLERTFELGPTWQITSVLRRVSPAGTPELVRVPILAGESVTESALEVKDGYVEVQLARDADVVRWTSSLKTAESIALEAAEARPYSERWTVRCGPIWRCASHGLDPVHRRQGGHWEPSFAPWPGEKLTLEVERPEAAEGQSTTVDLAELHVNPGVRMLEAKLALDVRSSRGANQRVTLPKDAQVRALRVDGVERPIRLEGNSLDVTLAPRSQRIEIDWQEPRGIELVHETPQVSLHSPIANTRTHVEMPPDRWLLWVRGPAWGPAILFWGYLLTVVLGALLLGRTRRGHLRAWQWALLGLGLTQIPPLAALVVVGWFFGLEWRRGKTDLQSSQHNLMQIGIIVWTMAALGCLYGAVHAGLLVTPDMQVGGANSSSTSLHWFSDRVDGELPGVSVISVPLWIWRALMLLWSLWLASSLVRWVPWAWRCFRSGTLWKPWHSSRNPPQPPAPAAPTAPQAPPASSGV